MRRVGAEGLLGDVAAHRLCQTCGTEPSRVKLADGIEESARVVRSVILVG